MIDDDRDLRDAFARLREAERHSVPRFAVQRARRSPARLAFALIALLLIVGGAFIARRKPHDVPETTVTISTWRAPTDFLLKTPGRELLDSTPRLNPQTPAINLSGGRS
jgi:hypothetical protein